MSTEDGDRLDWIFATDASDESLRSRYDRWAATYDADHDDWGWRGPEMVVTHLRHLGVTAGPIVDAGCGTGRAGQALRRADISGPVVGLDLSRGMLERAEATGAYDALVECSLYEVPLAPNRFAAVVSSGVFTHGHVDGSALAELARVTRPGGLVVTTQRLDLADELGLFADRMIEQGVWVHARTTGAEQFHPDRNATEQVVVAWRVC